MTMRFQDTQYAFAAHIRDPQQAPRPEDVEERRMQIYRELFYNNVEGFMANTYPVLHSILDQQRWHEILRDYFARHLAQTPLFPEMPREFLKYLEQEFEPRADDYPFLLELAHYEWVELALELSDTDLESLNFNSEGDLLHEIPLVSPLAWLLTYQYPVHQISQENIPSTAPQETTHIVVYRDVGDEVHFLESNAITLRLLQILQDTQQTGEAALQQLAKEIEHPQVDVLLQFGQQLLNDLQQRNIILGTHKGI